MKRTVTIGVPTLVLLGIIGVVALGVVTTTNSSAQVADDDGPWVLQPRRCSPGYQSTRGCLDTAYLFNVRTGEIFLITGKHNKYLITAKAKKKK